jgi:hypothetical protein
MTDWAGPSLRNRGTIYGFGISKEVADFLKVTDAAPILVGGKDVQDRIRKMNPDLPPPEAIQRVIDEIGLKTICTASNSTPQLYTINEDPRIKLITDIGLTTDLESLLRETFSSALAQRFAQVTGNMQQVTGGNYFIYGNPQASIVASMLKLEVDQGLAKREAISGTKPQSDLSILFLRGQGKSYTVGEREALFDPDLGLIQARSPGSRPLLADTSDERLRNVLSALMPASLSHELYHYLLFRPSIAESGLFMEGEATAYGEEGFRGALAGLAVPRSDPFREFTFKAVASGQADLLDTWHREVKRRIEATPFTANQCRFIKHLDESYLANGKHLPTDRLLTLTPSMFQQQNEQDLEDSYAVAWLIFHVANAEQRPWPPNLEELVRRMNEGEALSSADTELISTINKESILWLKETTRAGIKCDHPEQRLEDAKESSAP